MIQDQLVEYINAQMKLGVVRDSIKSTLIGAGWQDADVEDTLKKVESAKMSQPISAVAGVSPAVQKPGASGPQMVKMSDLVSASDSSMTMSVKPAASAAVSAVGAASSSPISSTSSFSSIKDPASRSPLTGPINAAKSAATPVSTKATTYQSTEYPPKTHSSHAALITEILLVIVILAVGGLAGYLYMQNNNLSGQIKSLQSQSTGVNSQASAMEAKIMASTTAYAGQISSLQSENQELQTELAFYAVPPTSTAGATTTATISGSVSGGGKVLYVITATYGGKIYVTNSKDASVVAALEPLVGTTTAQFFSGSYVPGSDSISLDDVNNAPVQ